MYGEMLDVVDEEGNPTGDDYVVSAIRELKEEFSVQKEEQNPYPNFKIVWNKV